MTEDQQKHEWRKFKQDMKSQVQIIDEEFEAEIFKEFNKITSLHQAEKNVQDENQYTKTYAFKKLVDDILRGYYFLSGKRLRFE